MDSVIRAIVVYVVLMLLFRLAGKRSLGDITTFDAVLLLIISEAVQQALIDGDESMTNAFLLIATLLALDVAMSLVTTRWRRADRLLNDVPLVVVEHGRAIREHMVKSRLTEDDILAKARALQGLERLDQIKYAVLERSGGITVVPQDAR